MKKRYLLLVLLFFSLISCLSKKGTANRLNLEKVKMGMTMKEVHQIMAIKPITLEKTYWADSLFSESYESEFGASDNHKVIYFTKDSTVLEVWYGD